MNLPIQLQDGEEVIKIIRRHPASLWGRLALDALILIAGLAVWLWLGPSTLLNIVFALVVVGTLLAGFMVWYRYHNDQWLITNRRLVDVTRTTPFNLQVTTASLRNVQDINIRMKGIFNTMLNFGDVICQTASSGSSTFTLIGVANPEKVLDAIDEARSKVKANA
jgi:hypothetical protein